MYTTTSDYLADNSLDCPHCGIPIEEDKLRSVEPETSGLKMGCPHCFKKIIVSLQIINLYTALRAET